MEIMERLDLVELCATALIFATLICLGCIDAGKIVRNSQGDLVLAALDLRACEVLAMKQFQLPSAEISSCLRCRSASGRDRPTGKRHEHNWCPDAEL